MQTLTELALAGHDSEAFSFLGADYIEQLTGHSAARVPLWTVGSQADGKLTSASMWNGIGCLAWTAEPNYEREAGGWIRLGSFVSRDEMLTVEALVLLRLLFGSGYRCTLNGWHWIDQPADPTLERLAFVRGYGGRSTDDPDWAILKAQYFDWFLTRLDVAEQICCGAAPR